MSAAEGQRPSAKHGLLRAGRRARSASDLRRRVSELQQHNELLLSFFSTLPKDSLQAAPAELRALLPEARAEAPRPHTVLPTVGRKPAEMSGASPPADASPDMPNELPALLLVGLDGEQRLAVEGAEVLHDELVQVVVHKHHLQQTNRASLLSAVLNRSREESMVRRVAAEHSDGQMQMRRMTSIRHHGKLGQDIEQRAITPRRPRHRMPQSRARRWRGPSSACRGRRDSSGRPPAAR